MDFVGNTRESSINPVPERYEITQNEIEEHNEMYVGKEISIKSDMVVEYSEGSELGYYYDSKTLFDLFRTPSSINPEEPILYIVLKHKEFDSEIRIIMGSDEAAFINIDNYYYKLKRVDE